MQMGITSLVMRDIPPSTRPKPFLTSMISRKARKGPVRCLLLIIPLGVAEGRWLRIGVSRFANTVTLWKESLLRVVKYPA